MLKAIVIGFVILVILIFLVLRINQRLTNQAKECAKGAKLFHERLQQLSDPSHLFTDEDVHRLKKEFGPLLNTVNKLYDSQFISNDYLDKLGLGDFMEERKLVDHMQYLNNIRQSESKSGPQG